MGLKNNLIRLLKIIYGCKEVIYLPKYLRLLGLNQFIQMRRKGISVTISLNVKGYKYPIYLRTMTSDCKAFKQMFISEEYGYAVPFSPKTIIDAGANCGYSAIYFANRYPDAKIIAIEPETSNYEMILMNTKEYKNVHVIKSGVWSKDCDLIISNLENANKWSFQVKEVPTGEGDMESISLDNIMDRYDLKSIDILKMDVEGAEKNIFEYNYDSWLSKTKFGFLELHETYAKGVEQVVNHRLTEYGFKKAQSGENIVFFK